MRLRCADRYPNASAELKRAIGSGDLHASEFEVACEFYERFAGKMAAEDVALLGCNDRYFLLTWLLNRCDAVHAWLYERCREVEAAPDGRIDLWSREHYKSTIITFAGAIQEILCDPEITIGIFSNTSAIARKFLGQIKRELESNEKLIGYYPTILWRHEKERKAAGVSWSETTGITVKRQGNPKEATVEAHGLIDSMPTGRHFGLVIFDDVLTEANVTNPEMISKTAERFELADNLGKAEGSRRQIVGTRYSYGDYYGEMIADGIAIPRIRPATDDGTIDGSPVFWTRPTWEEKKRKQRRTLAAQLLQNPLSGKEQTFRVPWLKPYWVRPQLLNVYIMGDPSHGRNKTSDRTAIAAIGLGSAPNKSKFFLDGFCHRMQLRERWERLRDLHKKWSKMPGVQLVKVGWERYGMQSDLDYFEEQMRLENYWFEIEEINWTGERGGESKKYRVERLEPDFRHGSFFVPGRVWHPAIVTREREDDRTPGDLVAGSARWYTKEEIKDDAGRIIQQASDDIFYRPCPGLHAEERRCKTAGENWRIMDPIRRIDEDKNLYDVTRVLFEEFRLFPFTSHDDLIDAVSRIYDMDPQPPTAFERVEVEDYPDA
jgi:hypothetical protein